MSLRTRGPRPRRSAENAPAPAKHRRTREPSPISRRVAELREPLTYRPFRLLWAAQVLSELGDWAARLALVVLVYGRTGSAVATAAAAACSLLPWLGPGQWLAAYTERFPRRRVMVCADLARALGFGLAALPLPLPVLLAVVFVAGLGTPPFEAARAAVRVETLPAPAYASSLALTGITADFSLIAGYLLGGGLMAALGAAPALLVNAATFAFSALLVAGLPFAPPAAEAGTRAMGRLRSATVLLARTPHLRRPILLVMAATGVTAAVFVLAAPVVVGQLHRGPLTIAGLSALTGLVTITTTALMPHRSTGNGLLRMASVLTAVGGVLSAVSLVVLPGLSGLVVAFAAMGVLDAVIIPANIVVGPRLPTAIRASCMSVLMGTLTLAQAGTPFVAGALAAPLGARGASAVALLSAGGFGVFALLRPVAVSDPADESADESVVQPATGDPIADVARTMPDLLSPPIDALAGQPVEAQPLVAAAVPLRADALV